MKKFDPRIIFGFLLIVGGGLALAGQMGYLQNTTDAFWGGMLAAVGLMFLALLFGGHWWAVFPGFTLLAIGALIFLPKEMNELAGSIFLGSIALSFWLTYVTAPLERWWALIPAGVLTTLAGVAFAADRFGGFQTGGFFFLGLALTFLLVALLAGMKWAYWPALVLGVMGVFGLADLFDFANYLWPIAFILGGGYLLFRAIKNR